MAQDVRTQLAAFRQSLLTETTLPHSGMEVTLKRVALMDLLLQGEIPDTLSGLVQQVLKSDSGKSLSVETLLGSSKDFQNLLSMFNLIAKLCIVTPPVADEPDDEHWGISEIPFEDKSWIFEWANGEANALTTFRQKSGSDDVAAHQSENVQPIT